MREHCEGSRQSPIPYETGDDGLRATNVTPTYRIVHSDTRVICAVCHEPRPYLKDGSLAKHTRYVSWKEQQARAQT